MVEQIAGEFQGRLKVLQADVDQTQEAAGRLGIMGVPTLVLFKGGREVGRTVGAQPKAAIVKQLERALS